MSSNRDLAFVLWFTVSASLAGCGSTPTSPAAAPQAGVSQLNGAMVGTLELRSVSGGCEAEFLTTHPDLLAQSAAADLQTNGKTISMTLKTAQGQECVFSGTQDGRTLTATSRHEACSGFPLAPAAISGIVQSCNTIDPRGDGPFWGGSELTASFDGSAIQGHWVYQVLDPGGGSFGPSRFTLDLGIHLTPRDR